MFMGMIVKPLFDISENLLHYGKYGIFPFVLYQRAKKKSKNREAGTMETKVVQNVNNDAIRDMLMQHVIPAIHSQWLPSLPKEVIIQWDNARLHQIPKNEEFVQACQANRFNIQMVFQPAQSLDLNVLDLGLFRVIQSLQYQLFPKILDELIEKVKEAYGVFDPILNKYTWITLQSFMICILNKDGGNNNYNTPHTGKKKLDDLGILPERLEVNRDLIHHAVEYLNTLFIPTPDGHTDDAHMEVDAD